MTKAIEKDPGHDAARDAAGRHARRPAVLHYVPARNGGNGSELLRIALRSGEETLPVFSSRRAAQNFLLSNALGREWYARESYAGELVSLLLGLYAGIERVLLDPLPGCLTARDTPANLMPRERFVHYLLG